jgi:response regulator of citrate/malate metabolism
LRDADTIKSCLANGAAGFIIKPFNAGTVLKVLRDAVIRAEQRTPPTRIS